MVAVAATIATIDQRRELLKTLFECFSSFPQLLAKMHEIFITEDEALNKAGMRFNSIADPSLIPRLLGSDHPDLIGKYTLYTMKMADLLRDSGDPSKLTIEQKQDVVKRFLSLSKEVKNIGEEIQRAI